MLRYSNPHSFSEHLFGWPFFTQTSTFVGLDNKMGVADSSVTANTCSFGVVGALKSLEVEKSTPFH